MFFPLANGCTNVVSMKMHRGIDIPGYYQGLYMDTPCESSLHPAVIGHGHPSHIGDSPPNSFLKSLAKGAIKTL